MIEADKRKAVVLLHEEGMSAREIARRLHLGRNTVNAIIAEGGQMPQVVRELKVPIEPELLQSLYQECEGWIERVHEKLAEEHQIQIPYPSLTRRLRQLGIRLSKVLPLLQSLSDEVFPSRSLGVLGLCRARLHYRQHQPGPTPCHRRPRGHGAGDGSLCPAARLPVRLP
jgi:transposase